MSSLDKLTPAGNLNPAQTFASLVRQSIYVRPYYFILLIVPWLLFLINPNWPFQGLDNMDPWYYFGHFIHFPHYQQLRPTYAGERLPWLIPGILLNALFQPAYAELILHVFCYWIALFSVFYLVRCLTNDDTALLAAVLMGSCPMFIAANGWTYVDSGCIVYFLLAFVCLMRGRAAPSSGIWLIAAGFFWAALIYTYLFWIVLTPCCAIFYLGLIPSPRVGGERQLGFLPTRYLLASANFLGGTLVATVVFSTIHLLIHGADHGFFFGQNIATAFSLGSGNNRFVEPGYAWVTSNGPLVFPVVTFFICLAGFVLHWSGRQRLDRASQGVLWTYVYSFAILVFFTVYRVRILAFSYYSSMLIPALFLALAVTALYVPKDVPTRLFGSVIAIGFLLSILSLWKAGFYLYGLPGHLWLHCVVAMVGTLLPMFSVRRHVWVICVVCLCGANFGLVPQYSSRAWKVNYNGLGASLRIGDAVRRIEAFLPYNTYPVFWIDNVSSTYTPEYRAIMCAFLSHGISMWHYPKIDVGAGSLPADYPPGTAIVLITENRDVFDQAQSAMSEMGMPLRLRGQQLVSRDHVSYWLTFTEVRNPAKEPGAVSSAVRVPLNDLRLSYEKASLERAGRSWRVVTASQQWAYAAGVSLPAVKTGQWSGTIQIRGRIVRGSVGFGLLNRSNQFATEQFFDGPSQETLVALPIDSSEDVGTVIVRNAGPGGPGEVILDSIDLVLPGRQVTDLGAQGITTTPSGGRGQVHGWPMRIESAADPDSAAASIPLSLKRSKGLFYLEIKAQSEIGAISVEVHDRNNKDHHEKGLLDRKGVTDDVFVRVPAGLQEGEVQFRNGATGGIRSKALVLDVVVWEVL